MLPWPLQTRMVRSCGRMRQGVMQLPRHGSLLRSLMCFKFAAPSAVAIMLQRSTLSMLRRAGRFVSRIACCGCTGIVACQFVQGLAGTSMTIRLLSLCAHGLFSLASVLPHQVVQHSTMPFAHGMLASTLRRTEPCLLERRRTNLPIYTYRRKIISWSTHSGLMNPRSLSFEVVLSESQEQTALQMSTAKRSTLAGQLVTSLRASPVSYIIVHPTRIGYLY